MNWEDNTPDFEEIVQALLDPDNPFPPHLYDYLGDLSPENAARLREIWPQIPLERRRTLMEDLENITENELLASFKDVGLIALEDEDPAVRFGAIRVLWVEDDNNLIPRLLEIARNDPDASVRANAVGALGNYMLLAALEELPWHYTNDIETTLMGFLKNPNEDDMVRRQALETLGYSLNLDMAPWIEEAFASPSEDWQASALFAAGRSGQERWGDHVMDYLYSTSPRLRAEAARAAGELMHQPAVDRLIELLEDRDPEVRMMAAWALSEIGGGEPVAEALEKALENARDEEEAIALEEALENLSLTDEMGELLLMDFGKKDIDDLLNDDEALAEFLEMFGGDSFFTDEDEEQEA